MVRKIADQKKILVLAALISVIWLLPATAEAQSSCIANANTQITVDSTGQQGGDDPFNSNQGHKIHGTNWVAQTFKVTGTGCFQLNQLTVSLKKSGNPSNLVVGIYDVASDIPTALKSSTIIAASSIGPDYSDVTITFGAPVQIQGNVSYALVLTQSAAGSGNDYYLAGANDGNSYTDGRYCKSGDSGASWDCPNGPNNGIDIRMSICVTPCPTLITACTRTQGYWKNHANDWPVSSVDLGNHSYSLVELLNIFGQPVGGNGLISMAHQLIAAKLNVAAGATPPQDVLAAISAADTLIGNLWVPPTAASTDFIAPSYTGNFTATLDAFNNGLAPGGPAHCE